LPNGGKRRTWPVGAAPTRTPRVHSFWRRSGRWSSSSFSLLSGGLLVPTPDATRSWLCADAPPLFFFSLCCVCRCYNRRATSGGRRPPPPPTRNAPLDAPPAAAAAVDVAPPVALPAAAAPAGARPPARRRPRVGGDGVDRGRRAATAPHRPRSATAHPAPYRPRMGRAAASRGRGGDPPRRVGGRRGGPAAGAPPPRERAAGVRTARAGPPPPAGAHAAAPPRPAGGRAGGVGSLCGRAAPVPRAAGPAPPPRPRALLRASSVDRWGGVRVLGAARWRRGGGQGPTGTPRRAAGGGRRARGRGATAAEPRARCAGAGHGGGAAAGAAPTAGRRGAGASPAPAASLVDAAAATVARGRRPSDRGALHRRFAVTGLRSPSNQALVADTLPLSQAALPFAPPSAARRHAAGVHFLPLRRTSTWRPSASPYSSPCCLAWRCWLLPAELPPTLAGSALRM